MNQEYTDAVEKKILPQYIRLEEDIMLDIVRRIRKTGEVTSTADWQMYQLQELFGYSSEDMERKLKQALNATYPEMFELYDKVVEQNYTRNRDMYEQVNAKYVPYSENIQLQQITQGLQNIAIDEMENFSQSLAFYLDYNGRKVSTPLSQVYSRYADRAMLEIAAGTFDYNTAIRKAVTELTYSGLRVVDYSSGRSTRIDVAVRRSVMTGVAKLTDEITVMNADALGTDFYEVDWHAGARPTHAVWQGRVYHVGGTVMVYGERYPDFATATGYGNVDGFQGANCYHIRYPFIPGVSVRKYTDEWLEEQNRREAQTKEWYGKEYNYYEATQKQRSLERNMRAQREKVRLMKEAGADPDDILLARAKYQAQLDEYARFCGKFGLTQQRERIYYDGLGRIAPRSVKEVREAASRVLEREKAERQFKMYDLKNPVQKDIIKSIGDSKQFDDIKAYFSDKYSISLHPSVNNLNFKAFKQAATGIDKVLAEFPQAQNSCKRLSAAKRDKNELAATNGAGRISFNSAIFDRYSKAERICSGRNSEFVKNSDITATGAHEAGHILELAICKKREQTDIGRSIAWRDGRYSSEIIRRGLATELCQATGKSKDELVRNISMYATENDSETLAEAVSDVITNGNDAQVLSRAIWEVLKNELG